MSIYKGNNLIAGQGVDTDLIRSLHDPDWANAVSITAAQLYAGYTAPSDGMFVCTGVLTPGGSRKITLNNVPIVSGGYNVPGSTRCPVSKGDLIKANNSTAWEDETRYFVPWK